MVETRLVTQEGLQTFYNSQSMEILHSLPANGSFKQNEDKSFDFKVTKYLIVFKKAMPVTAVLPPGVLKNIKGQLLKVK